MKDFLKMTLAAICGFLVVNIVLFLLGMGIVGAVVASGSATPVIAQKGVLTIDMSALVISEQAQESNPIAALSSMKTGGTVESVGLWDAIQALKTAADDPAVQYIYLKTDGSMLGMAHLEELRAALAEFRAKSGKAVVSYIEAPTTGSYYLASVADKVYMTSHIGATTMLTGVSSQMIFLGDILKKLGVNVQLIRHGKYKSAGEMFTKNTASAENREQNQRMVDALWKGIAEEIAQSRGLSVDALNSAIDNLKLVAPGDFVECGLVDELMTREQLRSKLADLALASNIKDVSFIPFADYAAARKAVSLAGQEIAVVYADGEIVDGKAKQQVAGDYFASVIAKLREDDNVKAVVLRVNSPGGSVLASEKIKAELDSLQSVKPLVASFGDYAASGGYWISNACDKIYTDNATLTGSIGVFSMVPELSKVADKLGVSVESVSSSRHGDMYGLMRPFDNAEYAYILSTIEDVYERFTAIVASGREMSVAEVDALGQGRVWAGSDALANGLADERGGLVDAVRYAASLAQALESGEDASEVELGQWSVQGYPTPPTQMEQILELVGNTTADPTEVLAAKLRASTKPAIMARLPWMVELK